MKTSNPMPFNGHFPWWYCAPELFHSVGDSPRSASDIRSYIVIFLEVYMMEMSTPFGGLGNAGIICTMVKHLGRFPNEWRGRLDAGEGEDSWFGRGLEPEAECDLDSFLSLIWP